MLANPIDAISLRALGDCSIETPSSTLTPNQDVLFATALFVILNRGRKITRDAIELAIWPELQNSANAHHRLRQTILKLKEAGFPIVREKGFLKCRLPILTDFDGILTTPKEHELPALPESFELLPDYAPKISIGYAHWLDEKRLEINSSLVRILLEHIRYARNRGEWQRVEYLTRTCHRIDRYNEEAILARAESVALRGGKLEAIALLDEYVKDLGDAPIEMHLPANIMKRRISERKEPRPYDAPESSFLGRSAELASLNSALEEAIDGTGQCWTVEADLGMGKSRLLGEFAAFAQLRGAEVRYTRLQRSDRSRPLSFFVEIVPALRQLRGAIGCSPDSLECLERLTAKTPLSTRPTDPLTIAENIVAAILDLFDAVCEERTVVLMVDDAQWLDTGSLTLLEAIACWALQHKLMLVFSIRTPHSDFQVGTRLPSLNVIKLEPLHRADSAALVKALLSNDPKQISQKSVDWIVEIGQGNPYFVRELVRQWQETGRQRETPASLVAITNQRLRRLSKCALQILQTCAILGRFSTIARLEEVLEFKTFELFDGLDELGQSSMVRMEYLFSDSNSEPEIACAHELIGSAALKMLSDPAQIAMHRRVALILERETNSDFSPSIVAESALHWEKIGDQKHAFRLTASYADHLMIIGFPSDACVGYRKAIDLCVSPVQRTAMLMSLIPALYAAGEWKEVRSSISELESLAQSTDSPLPAHSDIEMIGHEAKWRSSTEWSDLLQQVKTCIFAESATPEHRVRAAVLGLKLATNVGTVEELDQIYRAVQDELDNDLIDFRSRLYVDMVYHIDRGDMDRGEAAARKLVEIERGTASSSNLVWSLVNAAQAMRRCGEISAAIEFLEEAFFLAKNKKLTTRACTVAHHLVLTGLAKDDISVAQEWLKVAEELSTPSEDVHTKQELHYYGARIALRCGNYQKTSELCAEIRSDCDQSLLRRISVLALEIRIAVESSSSIAEVNKLITSLTGLYEVECARGGQDFEAHSLYLARKYVGETKLAIQQLEDYVHIFRRERGAPSQEIVDAMLNHAKAGD